MTDTNKPVISGNADAEQRKINWDDSNMRSTYANVSNVASTREEVMLLSGPARFGATIRTMSASNSATASS